MRATHPRSVFVDGTSGAVRAQPGTSSEDARSSRTLLARNSGAGLRTQAGSTCA